MTNRCGSYGHSQLPDNIDILLLDSLFQEWRTFVISVIMLSGEIAVTFWKKKRAAIAGASDSILLVGGVELVSFSMMVAFLLDIFGRNFENSTFRRRSAYLSGDAE